MQQFINRYVALLEIDSFENSKSHMVDLKIKIKILKECLTLSNGHI